MTCGVAGHSPSTFLFIAKSSVVFRLLSHLTVLGIQLFNQCPCHPSNLPSTQPFWSCGEHNCLQFLSECLRQIRNNHPSAGGDRTTKKPTATQQLCGEEHCPPGCKSSAPSFKKQPSLGLAPIPFRIPSSIIRPAPGLFLFLSALPVELTQTLSCFQVISGRLSGSAPWRCCRAEQEHSSNGAKLTP